MCLKYNFLANAALDRNEVTLAIDYYDKAIATGYADQQGVLLVRGTGRKDRPHVDAQCGVMVTNTRGRQGQQTRWSMETARRRSG